MGLSRNAARSSKPLPRRQGIPRHKGALNVRKTPGKFRTISRLPWRGIASAGAWTLSLLMAFTLLAGLSVGLLYGYRYLTLSPYFAVKSIAVEGNFRLTSREVLDTAGLDHGMNSLALSLTGIEKKLSRNPWVKNVSAKRLLPDRFIIRLQEKEPRFWVRKAGELYYADVYGIPVAPVSPDKFTSYPALEVDKGAEAMTGRLPDLIRHLSEARLAIDMASVSLVRLSPVQGVEVFLENNHLILSIGQEDWSANLERLAATLTDLSRRGELPQVREVRAHDAGVLVVKDKPVAWVRPYGRGES